MLKDSTDSTSNIRNTVQFVYLTFMYIPQHGQPPCPGNGALHG